MLTTATTTITRATTSTVPRTICSANSSPWSFQWVKLSRCIDAFASYGSDEEATYVTVGATSGSDKRQNMVPC